MQKDFYSMDFRTKSQAEALDNFLEKTNGN